MAKEDPKTAKPAGESVDAQETDVLRLFIIIMALCTVGIGCWGAYKAYALSETTNDLDGRIRTIELIERIIQIKEKDPNSDEIIIKPNPDVQPYLGKQEERAVRIRHTNLNWYISERLDDGNTYGFKTDNLEPIRRTARGKFVEYSLPIRFSEAKLIELARFILDVEEETRDVRAKEIRLMQMKGEGLEMTCRPVVTFNLWERKEDQ